MAQHVSYETFGMRIMYIMLNRISIGYGTRVSETPYLDVVAALSGGGNASNGAFCTIGRVGDD